MIFCLSVVNAQTFQWAAQIGGIGNEMGRDVVVDGAGNVYRTGIFHDTCDFDPGVGVYHLQSSPSFGAIFVSKVDAGGNFVWAKHIQGTGQSTGEALALDQAGNIYVVGYFRGAADFDPGAGIAIMTADSVGEPFILKLNAAGDFQWVKHFASISSPSYLSAVDDIKVDALGNIYTTGYFDSTFDFDPGAGVFPLTSAGSQDMFVSKLDANGDFLWAFCLGGASYDVSYAIEVDDLGNVYLTGNFKYTVDFDPGAGFHTLTTAGAINEVFVAKYDSNGNYVWAKAFSGGVSDFTGEGIVVDANHNVYSTGILSGSVDMDPGVGVVNLGTNIAEIYVSKLNSNGEYVWAISIPTSGFGLGMALAVAPDGNLFCIGNFSGTGDFDPGAGGHTLTSNGIFDVFILNLDSAGAFLDVWQMGGSGSELCKSLFVDATSSIYTTGRFSNTVDFDPGAGTVSFTAFGLDDSFVQKIGNCQMNSGVTVNGNTLMANQAGVSYQWLDCNLFAPVSGATSQSFSPAVSGNYAVIVSQGTCADTSTCTTVTITQTDDALAAAAIQVYPNPATETLTIQSQEIIESATLTNLLGAVVQMETTHRFSVAALPQGVYVLRIQTASGLKNARFAKQ
ncbi:MAG: hypothetical protein RLZZ519_323 [Bacteroidota bacterium]|jgi:hypothetical protein